MPFDICLVLYHDGPDRVLRAVRPGDRVFIHDNSEVNLGFDAGANLAAGQGDGPLLLFMNTDGDLEPGALDALEEALNDPEVVAAEASQVGRFDRGADPEWLSTACMAVRRDAFDKVGGFDERLFLYADDVDFSYRIAQYGRLVHVPQARFHHDDADGHRREQWRLQHLMYRNWLLVHHWHRDRTDFWSTVWAGFGCLVYGNFVCGSARLTGAAAYLVRRVTWPRPKSASAPGRRAAVTG
jgi:GT2 family glycosyltransferase